MAIDPLPPAYAVYARENNDDSIEKVLLDIIVILTVKIFFLTLNQLGHYILSPQLEAFAT